VCFVVRVTTPESYADLPPGHPLSGIATLKLTLATGDAEIVGSDGRLLRGNVGSQPGPTAITEYVFDLRTSTLRLSLEDGTVFITQIGTVRAAVDAPLVYLDQNQWIDLARVLTGSPTISGARKAACQRLIDLARRRDIILPLSAAHLVETAKKGGRQRTDVARSMVELSRGWQMRSPLHVRAHELSHMFSSDTGVLGGASLDLFTLAPEALWTDRFHAPKRRTEPDDLPAELRGLLDRLTWATSLTDVLLDTDPEVSVAGLEIASKWAASFQELAQHMRGNSKAKPYARDLTRTRFITDMQDDVAAAALRGGMTAESFGKWLRDDAESAFSLLPALGRIREVLHLRLVNADDKWHRNDLNDVLYLCSAAGYADVVVGEKKTCSYLRRVEAKVPEGANVFYRLTDALPVIEAGARSRTPD
jgi:hypothetical protein